MVIEGMAFPAQKQFPWKKFFLFFRLTHEAFHAVAVAVDVAVVLLTRWHKFGSKLKFFSPNDTQKKKMMFSMILHYQLLKIVFEIVESKWLMLLSRWFNLKMWANWCDQMLK